MDLVPCRCTFQYTPRATEVNTTAGRAPYRPLSTDTLAMLIPAVSSGRLLYNMYHSHEYAGLDDMASLLGLVSACWRRDGPRNRFHIGDVYWFLGLGREETPDQPHPQIRLWTDANGGPAGFAWLDGPESGDIVVHPEHRRRGIEEEMLEWLEKRHRQDAVPHEGKTGLEIGGYLDPSWQRLLEERGFVRDDRVEGVPHFRRSLDALEPSAPLNGFVIRSVVGEHEATKRAMVQREAFANLDFQMPGQVEGHRSTAPDKAEIDRRTRVYKNVMRLPGYRMDLDLVAVTGGGEFAACCTCWLDSENRVGEFEPVGCHPDFRRMGLTRAVMFEGLRRLKALGAESAVVETNPFNLPAIRLYESCGFTLVFSDPLYRKTFTR